MSVGAPGYPPVNPLPLLDAVNPLTLYGRYGLFLVCPSRGVMPQLSDTEWKHYRPRHPVAVPASYPRSPPEVVDNPALFRKVGAARRRT